MPAPYYSCLLIDPAKAVGLRAISSAISIQYSQARGIIPREKRPVEEFSLPGPWM